MSTSDESLKETGRCAAASIIEMVAALECDYDMLQDLRELKEAGSLDDVGDNEKLKELEEAAGECSSREDAETRIQEDALSIEVRGDWYDISSAFPPDKTPTEFCILLSTGGPATRIRGELDGGEPSRARLEVQDWGTPWTQYFDIEQDTLLAYARCFYFGEG